MSPSGLIPKGKVNVEPGGSIVVKVNACVLSSARVNPATTQSATKHVINLHILLFLLNRMLFACYLSEAPFSEPGRMRNTARKFGHPVAFVPRMLPWAKPLAPL